VNLYKFEEQRYGPQVVRFLSIKNDAEHKLGQTPIPDGNLKVYRGVDDRLHLSYEGQSSFKYIPVNEEVELNLGPVANVLVEPNLIDYRAENHRFDSHGDVAGWDEIQTFAVQVANSRDVPVKVEITRNFDRPQWDLKWSGSVDKFEKVDLNTVKFTLDLAPRSKKLFEYTVTLYQGVRAEDWSKREQQLKGDAR
jgi:hypothetical protein